MNRNRFAIWALAFVFAFGSAAHAQAPSNRKVFTNRSQFHVPLQVSDADRTNLRELRFYVKPPASAWSLQETGNSQTTKFAFNATIDGEFGFTIATVDLMGREAPPLSEIDAPQLIVVVDTRPPEFGASPLVVASGQAYIQCTMRDANPDTSTFTAEAESIDGSWQPLVPLDKQRPGVFLGLPSGLPARVRIGGKDKAGNTASMIVALERSHSTSVMLPGSPLKNSATIVQNNPAVAPQLPIGVAPVPTPTLMVAEPHVTEKPALTATRKLINSRQCELSYQLDGMIGVPGCRVEAFATKDHGQTWIRLGGDEARKGPFTLTLPSEGEFGIVLAVGVRNQPATPPTAGERPDWIVEVDSTPPEVKLESAVPGVGEEFGMLLMRWSVRDKNLKPDAVEVYWSPTANGPWQPIAKGLRSVGQYRWPIQREAGSKAHLKLECTDAAGNVGRFISPQPIALEAIKPQARVLGINAAAVRQ